MDIPSTHFSELGGMMASRAEAWFSFDRRYGEVIRTWCMRRGLNHASAEDISQEILLKLREKLLSYDPAKASFRSWLKSIVSNALTDRHRRSLKTIEPQGVGSSSIAERMNNVPTPDPVEELSNEIENAGQKFAAQVIERVKARVGEKTWQAYWQIRVEGRKAAEVAKELGIEIGSVYKMCNRIKNMLAEEIENACQHHE